MEKSENQKTGKRQFVGLVTSDKMDKTIVVRVTEKNLHRLYKKYINRSKKFHVHDENNDARTGDTVRICEHRRLSKTKAWMLVDIIERAK